jgi:sugar phosphate isomerase/epimerase
MFKNLSPSAIGITGHQSEMIELALTFGFEGIELDMAEVTGRAKLHGMPYARRLVDSAKILVGDFPLPVNWETEDEDFQQQVADLPEIAANAAEMGCTRCLAMLPAGGDKLPYHENFEFHKERFSAICKALEPSGIHLGLGFHAAEYLRKDKEFQFIHDMDALTLLINMVGAPNLGILLDVWDLVVGGGSIESISSMSADQIVAVQVAELPEDVAPADLDKDSRLLPGAENGRIDITAVLSSLKEIGYEGPVTVAPSRDLFRTRRRDLIARQTGEALDKVWREAGLPSNLRLLQPIAMPAEVEVVPAKVEEAPAAVEAAPAEADAPEADAPEADAPNADAPEADAPKAAEPEAPTED